MLFSNLRNLLVFFLERRMYKGFTLIELLVTIAIIAVLVVIVLVMINPFQRLLDSRDRRASSNVRAVGSAVGTCVTRETQDGSNLAFGPNLNTTSTPWFEILETHNGCGSFTWMSNPQRVYSTSFRPSNPTIRIFNNDTSTTSPTRICVWAQVEGTNDYWLYSTNRQKVRKVTLVSAPSNCDTFDTL